MLVHGRYVIPHLGCSDEEPLSDMAILVQGDRISEIGPFPLLAKQHPGEQVVGDGHQLVIPGLVDAHSHGRGIPTPRAGIPYSSLESWLLRARGLPPIPLRLQLLLSICKHLHSGFTTMHYIHIPELSLPQMEQAMEEAMTILNSSGIRFAFSVPIKDQNFITYDDFTFLSQLPPVLHDRLIHAGYVPDPLDIAAFRTLFKRFHSAHSIKLSPVFLGPVGPQWCSDNLLSVVRDLSEETGSRVNIHTLQTVFQKTYGTRVYRESLVEHLRRVGLLNDRLTLGHAIWLTEDDICLVAHARTSITHHAGCNLHLGNGIAPLNAYLDAGIEVAMGMDDKPISQDEDGFQEMRLISLLHTVEEYTLDPHRLSPSDVLGMATTSGASVLGLANDSGCLEVGRLADLVLVDCKGFLDPWFSPEADIRELLLSTASAADVHTVIVGGREVFRDGHVVFIDEEELVSELSSCLHNMGRGESVAIPWEDLAPYVSKFYSDWGSTSSD